jgi:hypothetical protein
MWWTGRNNTSYRTIAKLPITYEFSNIKEFKCEFEGCNCKDFKFDKEHLLITFIT